MTTSPEPLHPAVAKLLEQARALEERAAARLDPARRARHGGLSVDVSPVGGLLALRVEERTLTPVHDWGVTFQHLFDAAVDGGSSEYEVTELPFDPQHLGSFASQPLPPGVDMNASPEVVMQQFADAVARLRPPSEDTAEQLARLEGIGLSDSEVRVALDADERLLSVFVPTALVHEPVEVINASLAEAVVRAKADLAQQVTELERAEGLR